MKRSVPTYYLTFDYELFGSGKGNVFKHLVNPTSKILEVLSSYNVKATFYIEQLEIEALISLKDIYPENTIEHTAAIAIENQLRHMIKLGHDLQLHLHPQWYGATYENGSWKLNFNWWRFSDLPFRTQQDGTPGKYDLVHQGKMWLDKLVSPEDHNYRCNSFRAGGYNVGDDITTINALLENGIKLDSSVCYGYFANTTLSRYDYTSVDTSKAFWYSDRSLLRARSDSTHPNKCLELPLVSIYSNFWEKIGLARILMSIKNRSFKKISFVSNVRPISPKKPEKKNNSNYDVCLATSGQIKALENKISEQENGISSPIVLIGHPKDYCCFSPLRRILKDNISKVHFETVSDFVQKEY